MSCRFDKANIYKDMTKTKKVTVSRQDELRMRVIKLKAQFPKGFDYTPLYQYEFGGQSADQLNKIRAVWNLRDADEAITANLEKIANNISE